MRSWLSMLFGVALCAAVSGCADNKGPADGADTTTVDDVADTGVSDVTDESAAGDAVDDGVADGDADGDDTASGLVTEARPIRTTFVIPTAYQTISLQAGVPAVMSGRVHLAELAEFLHLADASVDLEATVEFMEVEQLLGGEKIDGEVLEGSLQIGAGTAEETICDAGSAMASFTIGLGDDRQPSGEVEPAEVAADAPSLDAMNSGDFAACLTLTAPFDARVRLTHAVVDYTIDQNCTDEPADIDGVWTGTYQCEDFCGDEPSESFPQDIRIEIVQEDRRASYTDGEADYEGTVCGRTFSYSGGGQPEGDLDGYSESGRFVLGEDGNTATKTSRWRSGDCYGECSDTLTRGEADGS